MAGRISIADIQRAVADELGVPLGIMREPDGARDSRSYPRSHPRQMAMLLSARLTEHSLSRIGFFFGGRDHSTVIWSCTSAERRCAADPKLHNAMRRVTLELLRGAR
jgi:chromosomal replication initiator protein